MEVPLDHADPGGPTLRLRLRHRPAATPGAGQLWLLDGGPGYSAVDDFPQLLRGVDAARPDLDIFALDHRGVGRGPDRLGCPTEEAPASEAGTGISEAEWPACVAALEERWGSGLAHFSTTASARDLGLAIRALAPEGTPVFLWAGSYGTWLAFRYLHLFPTQPAGVVLEGVSPPGRGFLGYDTELDEVGRALLALCAADASCASHLGTDPAARAEATLAAVDAGHCAVLGTNADFWRTFLGTMLMYAQVRDLVPAVLYRLERCETDDARAIAHLYHRLFDPAPAVAETEPSVSMPLFFHVALSEMWAAPRSVEEAEDAWRATIFSTALEVRLARRAPSWPVYAPDGFEATLPRYEGPLLLLQGGLDPATPARHVLGLGQTYAAAGQTTALFPRASHNLVGSTPTADGRDCARELLLAFLADPAAALDLRCIDEVPGPFFDGTAALNQYLLGVSDAWGDN